MKYYHQQIVGGTEHTLRAKLTFSQESHGGKFSYFVAFVKSDS